MRFTLCLLTGLMISTNSRAADIAEPLVYFLKKSELVLLATIDGDPVAQIVKGGSSVDWRVDLTVVDVLQGKLDVKKLRATIRRFGLAPDDKPPFLKKGARIIVFLKNEPSKEVPVNWQCVDPWFGVQQGSETMAEWLKEYAKDLEKDKEEKKAEDAKKPPAAKPKGP